jgi:hypothetical protein
MRTQEANMERRSSEHYRGLHSVKGTVLVGGLALVCALVLTASHAAAWEAATGTFIPQQATMRVPVSGRTSEGGTFTGQVMVHRFLLKDGLVAAEAMVTGTVIDATGALAGNFLTGPVVGAVTARRVENRLAAAAMPQLALGEPGMPSLPSVSPGCELLSLEATGLTLNVMGLAVTATQPIGLQISGAPGRPLGNLVCQTVDALSQPPLLVTLLNELLKMLGGTGLQA